jgi:hypothetical protein
MLSPIPPPLPEQITRGQHKTENRDEADEKADFV